MKTVAESRPCAMPKLKYGQYIVSSVQNGKEISIRYMFVYSKQMLKPIEPISLISKNYFRVKWITFEKKTRTNKLP